MIIPVYQLNGQGELQAADLQVHSLAELARVEPPGVYTVARTYRGDQAVMLDAHLNRLEESARLENIPFELDRKQLRTGLHSLLARAQQRLPKGVYEGVVLSEADELLEGFSSNFYGVLEGERRTSEEQMLYGIARRIVVEVAADLLPVRLEPVRRAEFPGLQEALLSSSGRGVVPIVQVNECRIGDGAPGPMTRAIQAGYDSWVERHLEPI